jgi:endonuclease-3
MFTVKKNEKLINIIIESYKVRIKKSKKQNVLDTLIATKLSQNSTDKTAIIAYNNLKRKYKNWEKLINAPMSEIENEIKVCGMHKTKSRDIKNLLSEIKNKYGKTDLEHFGKLNKDEIYKELTSYKGIGYKTASCVLGFALGRNVFPVDTHIHRILNRTGIVKTKNPDETFQKASILIPDNEKIKFHKSLILFGREICKAIKPLCYKCNIEKYCIYRFKNFNSARLSKNKANDLLILDSI